MNNLFIFLKKQAHLFLFLCLTIVSLICIFNNYNYQRYIFSENFQIITFPVYKLWGNITKHFKLETENSNLIQQNKTLLETFKSSYIEKNDTSYLKVSPHNTSIKMYSYTDAHVISSSNNRKNNYLILDKGYQDGIRNDMAVIAPNGIVGVVNHTSQHFSSVISLLHTESRISSRIIPSNYIGTIVWMGNNATEANLIDIPFHLKVNIGDTIVTSGYSLVFPKDLIIGTVKSIQRSENSSFYSIIVKLAVNFNYLNSVYVIQNVYKEEIDSLKSKFKND